jgi:hypothetical protein
LMTCSVREAGLTPTEPPPFRGRSFFPVQRSFPTERSVLPPARGELEGGLLRFQQANFRPDSFCHCLKRLIHIPDRNSQYRNAPPQKELIPQLIPVHIMPRPIHLHGEFQRSTIIVDKIRAYRMLPSERSARLTAAQIEPKLVLGRAHLTSQDTGTFCFLWRASEFGHDARLSPSPSGCQYGMTPTQPPPFRGRSFFPVQRSFSSLRGELGHA